MKPTYKLRMTLYFAFFFTFTITALKSQNLGVFTNNTDVGAVKTAGTTTYDTENQTFSISGSGENIWFQKDEFQFAYRKMTGDFILRAHLKFEGDGVDPHRKAGWMIRHSLETNSPCVLAAHHAGDGLTSLQYRSTPASDMQQQVVEVTYADVIQLERKGNVYTMSAAKMGERFFVQQISDVELGDDVYVGLFVSAHNADVVETATFKNVRVVVPPFEGYQPYRDYIGSHIELMDVETGDRKIVYSAENSLQAPNWMVDKNVFTINSDGLLYDFDLRTGKPTKLNTDFADNNNNDHVYSMDGKRMGISHAPPGGQSTIYTLSRKGGTPKQLTPNTPSYLHGWSPDKEYLVYTGIRDGITNIYRIPSKGGEEENLTKATGLNDGSEYSPDGKYIYFNSDRTGTSQIWRMDADGANPTQITFDELNDWFPHVSPDGKWIVLISFPRTVNSAEHPFYQHVYIRLMPITGGEPKIIGYVYGGQGTMNVPNWSPDGKKIAFVSNSTLLNY